MSGSVFIGLFNPVVIGWVMRGMMLVFLLAAVVAVGPAQTRHRAVRRSPRRPTYTQRRVVNRRGTAGLATGGRWATVATWTGFGPQTTDPFTIKGKKWRVAWSFTSTA